MIYLILIFATLIRLVIINQSFWLDEAASLMAARVPLTDFVNYLSHDFHPPLYYLLLHFWLKFGLYQESFLRLLSVIFGVLTVYVLYHWLLEALDNKKIALVAALLLAVNPFHIYYSQELRPYVLNAFLSLLSWLFLFRFLKAQKKLSLVLFILVSALNYYTFYGAFFNLLGQLVFVIIYYRRHLLSVLTASFASLLLFLPWLPTLMLQLRSGSSMETILPGWSVTSGLSSFKSLALIPLKFATGRINLNGQPTYQIVAALVCLYLFLFILLSLRQRFARHLLVAFATPILIAFVVSFQFPSLGYWRYLFLLPFFLTFIALGLSSLPRPYFLFNLIFTTLVFIFLNLIFWFTPTFQREDWRSALNHIQSTSALGSISVFAFPDAFAPVFWYAPALKYVAPLKDFANTDLTTIDLSLSQATTSHQQIFYFDYLTALSDPDHRLRLWLQNAGFVANKSYNFPGVGLIYEYTRPN